MRNFTHHNVKDIVVCTALPNQKLEGNNSQSIAVAEQTTSDLGFMAAEKIITARNIEPDEIGALVFLSKTPDYRGPATAMVLQNRLDIPVDCIVYDSPMGSGGFENAVNLGLSLLSSISKKYVLVVFGDTVSKQLTEEDMQELNFQDGATAMILERGAHSFPVSMATVTLSDYWRSFMVPSGGFRNNESFYQSLSSKRPGQLSDHIHINEADVFKAVAPEMDGIKEKVMALISDKYQSNFAIAINLLAPRLEQELAGLFPSEIRANHVFLSSNLLPQTMASTIPLMLSDIIRDDRDLPFQIISVSLGEGLSVNVLSMEVNESTVLEPIYSDAYYSNGFVTHEM